MSIEMSFPGNYRSGQLDYQGNSVAGSYRSPACNAAEVEKSPSRTISRLPRGE
jgi:hypothetical protein